MPGGKHLVGWDAGKALSAWCPRGGRTGIVCQHLPNSFLKIGTVRRIQASLLNVRFLTDRLAFLTLGCSCDFSVGVLSLLCPSPVLCVLKCQPEHVAGWMECCYCLSWAPVPLPALVLLPSPTREQSLWCQGGLACVWVRVRSNPEAIVSSY